MHSVSPLTGEVVHFIRSRVVKNLEAEVVVENVVLSNSIVSVHLFVQLRPDRKSKVVYLY